MMRRAANRESQPPWVPLGRLQLVVIVVATSVIALGATPTLAGAQEAGDAAGAQEPRASLPDIEDEVMCPICGTALNLSESPQAERERAFIRRLIAEGQTKEQIKDALVVEYGEEVLAIPDTSGFDLTAWIVPGLGIGVAVVALGVGIARWRRSSRDAVLAGSAPQGLGTADKERLESDLAKYDL